MYAAKLPSSHCPQKLLVYMQTTKEFKRSSRINLQKTLRIIANLLRSQVFVGVEVQYEYYI